MKAHSERPMSLKFRTAEATLRMSPVVLSTSRMLELMELAAVRLMRIHLADGETSASTEMTVTHVAPAGAGGTLRAVAAYQGISGRLHRFTINVFDESGLIGSAEHTRAVVSGAGLLDLARRRVEKASALLTN
jgi:fluoroacetyl-CoA thioesterase